MRYHEFRLGGLVPLCKSVVEPRGERFDVLFVTPLRLKRNREHTHAKWA